MIGHQTSVKLEEHNGDIVSVTVEYSYNGYLLGRTDSDSTGIRHYLTRCEFDCSTNECIHHWYWEEVDYKSLSEIVPTESMRM